MPSKVRIIGAASGLGAQDHACEDGPVAFHRSQAWHELAHQPRVDWGKTLFASDSAAASGIGQIAGLCRRLAAEVASALSADEFPLVIGGDHSIAIGTWSGVARGIGEPPGLLWIDAHLDSHTPETSYSGAVHGMPLACLLGRGDKRLLNIGLNGPQISAAHTVVFGPRSYETEEVDFLRTMGVRVISGEDIDERGFSRCLAEAIGIVCDAPAGFGVTLDLDAIDPALAPGVGSPEPDGLWDGDVVSALRRLSQLPGLRAMEIVEYNPDRDWQGRTAQLMTDLIEGILPGILDGPSSSGTRFQG